MSSMLLPLLLLIFTTLIVPILIVIFWKRRPVIAFIVAAIMMLGSVLLPPILIAFGEMMKGGASDPMIVSGNISTAISVSLFCMIFLFPILAGVQWLARRKYVNRQRRLSEGEAFE